MNANTRRPSRPGTKLLVLAIQACLLSLMTTGTVLAQDEEADALLLTHPTSWIGFGIGNVSDDSFKFGEYNGLYKKGAYGILNFEFKGGGAWDSEDATRWTIKADKLGLDGRELGAEYGKQGVFRISVDYDLITRRRSDSYQTPYLGAGSDTLTLPSTWLSPRVPQVNSTNLNFRVFDPANSQTAAIASGVVVQPSPAQITQMNAILAADTAAFHNENLDTRRERGQVGFRYQLSRHWDVQLSAQSEHKSGLKPMSTVTSQTNEFAAVIPDLIDQDTQQYNLGLNYTNGRNFVQLGYYASIFDNQVKSMTWADARDPTKSATMSSAPGNQFHQFNVAAGYQLAEHTRLVANGSYSRSTQNQAFLTGPQLPLGLPVDSLDGLVVARAFNLKLSSQPVDGLSLNAAYKYDDRDNRTPVNIYIFQDADEARANAASAFNAVLGLAPNTLGSNINIYANRPYGKTVNQFDADANYRFAPGQDFKLAYRHQQIDRGCDGSWINCADAPKVRENTAQFEWRMSAIENVSASLSWAHSRRNVEYDENAFLALVPMANFIPAGGATVSVFDYLMANGLTGFGPYAGYPLVALTGNAAIYSPNNNIVPQALYGSRNNINELLGLRRFNMADRSRDKFRGRLEIQASDRLALGANVDYDKDDYSHSLYGLTGSRNWALNLDGDFSVNENLSLNAYYSYEDRDSESAGRAYGSNSNTAFVGVAGNTVVSGGCYATVQERNRNTKIDQCLEWTSNSKDKVATFGMGMNYRGLAGGKVSIASDIVGSRARTKIGVLGGSYVNNPFAAAGQPVVNPAVYFIPAADFPTIKTDSLELRMSVVWALSADADLRFLYGYAHLRTSDYMYDGMQFGALNIVMPTNEKPPSYNINLVGVSYTYRMH